MNAKVSPTLYHSFAEDDKDKANEGDKEEASI